jgi:tetratricopeptide (TPR) repeat protein
MSAADRRSPILRVVLAIALGLATLMATGWFGMRFVAGIEQLRGKGRYYRNDVAGALKHYARARRFGGAGLRLDMDEVEALFFGVDQIDSGARVPLPMTADEAMEKAVEGVRGLLQRAPYRSYFWSIASDVYMRRARVRRRATPLDLSTLSENPLDNLLPEMWLAIATMEHASQLEPNNYLYHDLLVEAYLDAGSPEAAVEHCRRAVKALPQHDAHEYLTRPGVPAVLVEAAVGGFEDAQKEVSLLGRSTIKCNLAEMLVLNGQYERAIPYLLSALENVPRSFVGHFYLAEAQFHLGRYKEAQQHFELAARIMPSAAWTYFWLAKSYEAADDLDRAVAAMQSARLWDPHEMVFFHALGAMLEKAHRTSEAERQFVAATSYNATNPYAWSTLVEFYVRQGDRRAARMACDRLLQLRPGDTAYQSQCQAASAAAP